MSYNINTPSSINKIEPKINEIKELTPSKISTNQVLNSISDLNEKINAISITKGLNNEDSNALVNIHQEPSEATLENLCGLLSTLDISFNTPEIDFDFELPDFKLPSLPTFTMKSSFCHATQEDNVESNKSNLTQSQKEEFNSAINEAKRENKKSSDDIKDMSKMVHREYNISLNKAVNTFSGLTKDSTKSFTALFSTLASQWKTLQDQFQDAYDSMLQCRFQGISVPLNECQEKLRKALKKALLNKGLQNAMESAGVSSSLISAMENAAQGFLPKDQLISQLQDFGISDDIINSSSILLDSGKIDIRDSNLVKEIFNKVNIDITDQYGSVSYSKLNNYGATSLQDASKWSEALTTNYSSVDDIDTPSTNFYENDGKIINTVDSTSDDIEEVEFYLKEW